MTRNKKKLRRAERRSQFNRAAQTFVLTGLLLAGGVGVAGATNWGDEVNVVINADETLSNAQEAGNLTIDAGKTLTTSGHNVILSQGTGYGNVVINGTLVSAGGPVMGIQQTEPYAYYGTATVTGKLELTAGGSLSMDSIAISGGADHKISGEYAGDGPHPDLGAWRKGSMVYAGHDLTVTGATVTLGDYGLLGVGSSETTSGADGQYVLIGKNGVVKMEGGTAAKASVLRAYDKTNAQLRIENGGQVTASAGTFGVIGSETTTVSGVNSYLTVADTGYLEMIAALPDTAATAVSDAGLTFTSGTLNLKDGGRVNAEAFALKGGAINIDGGVKGAAYETNHRSGIYDTDNAANSGELTLDGSTVNVTNGGGIEVSKITLSDGELNVSGSNDYFLKNEGQEWRNGSLVYAAKSFTMSGGALNVGDSGMVLVDSGSGNALAIESGTVTLGGSTADKAAMLRACADGSNDAVLTIGKDGGSDDATVTVNGYARIMGNGAITVADKGLVTVQAGSHLLVSNDSSAALPAFSDAALEVRDTILTIDGGTVDVTGNVLLTKDQGTDANITFGNSGGTLKVAGDMDISSGALDMKNSGTVNVSGTLKDTSDDMDNFSTSSKMKGTLYTGALQVKAATSTLTVDGSDQTTVGFYGLGKDTAFYNGSSITVSNANATLNLGGADNTGKGAFTAQGGTYGGDVKVTSGTLTVSAGDWTLNKSLEVGSSSSLKVDAGSLDVSGGSLKVDSGATTFSVGTTGALTAKFSDFTADSQTLNSAGVNKELANNGMLVLAGATATELSKIDDLTKLNTLTTVIQGTAGTGTIKITGLSADLANGETLTDVSKTGVAFTESTVTAGGTSSGGTTTEQLQGSTAVKAVDATGVTDATYVIDTNGKGFALVGDGNAGTQLVQASDGTTVEIKGDLKLGDQSAAGKTGGGTLTGDITAQTPGTDGNVTAFNGDFTVTGNVAGDALAAQNSSLTIGGTVGGDATAANAGSATHVGGDVTGAVAASGDGSTVTVGGDVGTGVTADGTGSTVIVGGDVAAGGVKADNSTVAVRGDVTGNITASGSIITVGDVAGDVALSEGSAMAAGTVTGITQDVTVSGGSSLTVDSMNTNGNNVIVGADGDTTGSSLVAATLDLGTGFLILDPDWTPGVYNPTQAAVENFTGSVAAGRNSQMTIGTTDKTWLSQEVQGLGNWSKDGITAALGIYKPYTMGNTLSITVDGSKTSSAIVATPPSANAATFADNSLLVVNGAIGSTAAITAAGGTATVADGAKLRVVNPKAGTTYTVLSGFTGGGTDIYAGNNAWNGTNLTTNSRMLTLERLAFDTAKGDAKFKVVQHAATSIFPDMSEEMGGLVDSLYRDGRNDVNSKKAGIRFLSRATSEDYLSDADRVAPTLEGAAQMAAVGAAPGMTLAATEAATNAVATRTSFASPLLDKTKAVALHMDADGVSADAGLSAGDGLRNGLGLWIMPLYQSSNVWGMKAEEFKTGYHGDLGGVALGADYTFQDMFRIGVALNLGGGYAESSGDFNKTTNSFNFWGVNLYGGWTQNNFGITADLGYTGNYNKLKQETPDSMGMGDLKGDVTSTALTAGLRGEYKVETSVLDLIPHVGVRYTDLTVDGYDVKRDGTVFEVDRSRQSIWTFPVGITASKTIETGNGWQFKPQVDFTVIPAAGDVKAKSKVRVPGVDASAELKTQVVDYMTYQGGVGFDVQKDNVSFGLNYTIQASEHRTGHGVFGTLRYEF